MLRGRVSFNWAKRNRTRKDSPFAVLIHVGVRLHRILFDQELDALVEGNGH